VRHACAMRTLTERGSRKACTRLASMFITDDDDMISLLQGLGAAALAGRLGLFVQGCRVFG